MQRRLRILALAGLVSLIFALLPELAMNVAYARWCSGSYCVYEAQGWAGLGAHGTGAYITLPGNVDIPHTDDQVIGTVFLLNGSTAIETGASYGYSSNCGTNYYWYPYGAKNNGGVEQDACDHDLNDYTNWQAYSYVSNGYGYSSFKNSSGTPIFTVNWGPYNFGGQNMTMTEVHGDGDQPYFSGPMNFYYEQWYDGSVWSYWGFSSVGSDCPYAAVYQGADEWYSHDAGSTC